MTKRPSAQASPYAACSRKTLHSALCHLLRTEFPGVFGPAITRLFADKIGEIVDRFQPPRSRLRMGQALWTAVAIDDPEIAMAEACDVATALMLGETPTYPRVAPPCVTYPIEGGVSPLMRPRISWLGLIQFIGEIKANSGFAFANDPK